MLDLPLSTPIVKHLPVSILYLHGRSQVKKQALLSEVHSPISVDPRVIKQFADLAYIKPIDVSLGFLVTVTDFGLTLVSSTGYSSTDGMCR